MIRITLITSRSNGKNNHGYPNNQDIREPNEADTPFNMDEEEPDPDEEPSEERGR